MKRVCYINVGNKNVQKNRTTLNVLNEGLKSDIPRKEKLMFLCEFLGDGPLPQLNSKTFDNTPRLTIHSFYRHAFEGCC